MLPVKEVEILATLGKLRLTEAEKDKFRCLLSRSLESLDIIAECDTSAVHELTYAKILDLSELRRDVTVSSADRDELLKNAPQQSGGAYLVPEVLE